jgi:Snare region anchored in the vesicle membrane C-terminus/Vesicle transport v-SNARE protein N-terminus
LLTVVLCGSWKAPRLLPTGPTPQHLFVCGSQSNSYHSRVVTTLSPMPHDGSFEAYEEEYQFLTSQIQRQLGARGHEANLQRQLSHCESILQQLTIEARNCLEKDEKEELLSRVKLYKIQLQSFKQYHRQGLTQEVPRQEPVRAPSLAVVPDRSSAVSLPVVPMAPPMTNRANRNNGGGGDDPLSTRMKLGQQNATLERARRAMADTEETAGVIAEELHRNRETIERSHDRVAEMSGLTNDANRILSRMKKRWF